MTADWILLGSIKFPTKIAITSEEKTQGLMNQLNPPIMSFVFEKAIPRKFWMKNTFVPLDLVFCQNNKIIDIKAGKPLSLDFISSESPVDLVVELPFGMCQEKKISVGQTAELTYSLSTLVKKWENTSKKE